MRNDTRLLFTAFASHVALAHGIADATVQFAVDPNAEQLLEAEIRNNSEFLGRINIVPVTNQKAAVLGIGVSRSIASRTDTSNNTRRNPTDPGASRTKHTYTCEETEFDWSRPYAILDAWRHDPRFEMLIRDDIVNQIALDRQMIGFHGTSIAAETDRAANPKLQDVNEGWLHKIRTDAPAQVMDDGALTVHSDDTDDDALKAIYVAPGAVLFDGVAGNQQDAEADYASLDALVRDGLRGIHESQADDTDLVVIVGRNLIDDKYFTIAQTTGATATEVEATDRILMSTKSMGGLPAMRVTGFPANSILITKLSNLSIYWQEGSRRRQLVDEPQYKRIANYESLNEAYVVEDYELAVLIENIEIGKSPNAGAKPAP